MYLSRTVLEKAVTGHNETDNQIVEQHTHDLQTEIDQDSNDLGCNSYRQHDEPTDVNNHEDEVMQGGSEVGASHHQDGTTAESSGVDVSGHQLDGRVVPVSNNDRHEVIQGGVNANESGIRRGESMSSSSSADVCADQHDAMRRRVATDDSNDRHEVLQRSSDVEVSNNTNDESNVDMPHDLQRRIAACNNNDVHEAMQGSIDAHASNQQNQALHDDGPMEDVVVVENGHDDGVSAIIDREGSNVSGASRTSKRQLDDLDRTGSDVRATRRHLDDGSDSEFDDAPDRFL
jgi:hypothetical protein